MTASGAPAVAVSGLTMSFDGDVVLDGIDLVVASGEVVALLGPSGCGKTTALRIVAGLLAPDAGTVELGGTLMTGRGVLVAPEQRGVGLIFQNGALFPHLSAARNVGYGLPRSERRVGARIDEMLALVGLDGLHDRMPDSLSGGQAQRVALARALAPAPSVVLMDEPFSNLDAVLRERLRREIGDVVRAAGVTAVFVTHDRDEAFSIADRVAVMRDGRIVQHGSPRDLYERPVDAWVAAFVGDVNEIDGELVRPEQLELCAADVAGARSATVVRQEYLGVTVLTEVQVADSGPWLVRALSADAAQHAPGDPVKVRRRPR